VNKEGTDYPATSTSYDAEAGTLTFTMGAALGADESRTFKINLQPKAENSAFVGASETEIPYTHVLSALPAPENLKLTMNGNTATLTWDAVDGATGYEVYKNGGEKKDVVDCNSQIAIGGTNTDVTYTVIAKGDGATVANSEAAEIVVKKMAIGTDVVVGFNNTTPVNLTSGKVNYTLTASSLAAQYKKALTFTSNVSGVTVAQDPAAPASYYVAVDEAVKAGAQQTVTLTAQLCGQLTNGTWVYGDNVVTTTFKVGQVANTAALASAQAIVASGATVDVKVNFTDLIKNSVNTTAITAYAVLADGSDSTLIPITAKGWETETLRLRFGGSALTVGATYDIVFTLPVKDAHTGLYSSATFTLEDVVINAYQ
jgi:hypothetical protein